MEELTIEKTVYVSPDGLNKVFKGVWGAVPVAVKELPYTLQAANEYSNQASLYTVPSVCRVYTCFPTCEGYRLRIVMEWLDHDLFAEIEERKGAVPAYWTEAELWTMFRTLIDTLAFAQIVGISHRDIKPQNIYMTSEGGVKVGDFGCSKQTSLTTAQTILGSPYFLSPELKGAFTRAMVGQPTALDYDPYRSDVYSLGVTFTMMVLLRESIELMDVEHLGEVTAVVLGQIQSSSIRELIGKMLEVDPRKRPDFVQMKQYVDYLYGSMSQEYCSAVSAMLGMEDQQQVQHARKAIDYFPLPSDAPQPVAPTAVKEPGREQSAVTGQRCEFCHERDKFTRCVRAGSLQNEDTATHNICVQCIRALYKEANRSKEFHCARCMKKIPRKKILEALDSYGN